jgi:N6-L-threonylcarbamoyladenine synthase
LDDAVGECLDKSSILMGHSYPGGPIIEKLALKGENKYKLPFPKNDKTLDFSFSGLKSEINRIIKKDENVNFADLANSLQTKIAEIIVKKMKMAWTKNGGYKSVIMGGGVIANKFLRNFISKEIKS